MVGLLKSEGVCCCGRGKRGNRAMKSTHSKEGKPSNIEVGIEPVAAPDFAAANEAKCVPAVQFFVLHTRSSIFCEGAPEDVILLLLPENEIHTRGCLERVLQVVQVFLSEVCLGC